MFKFQMYEVVVDKVSGFQGVILGRTEYSTGCRHYGISPRSVNKDGKLPEWEWIDESRLELTGEIFRILEKSASEPSAEGFNNPPEW